MSAVNNINKIILGGLFVFIVAITAFFAWNFIKQGETKVLTIGAGSKNGEAYIFAQAIADVTTKHFPEIHIKVMETAGSKENMELLESGEIELATVQADIPAVPSARIISNLYPDMFQLIVREDADINSFQDLKGKRMSLPSKGGGQWISFWFTANYYDVFESDITNVSLSSDEAVEAFIDGEIDAIFKVRAPRNKSILSILSRCPSKLISIDQASAMKLKQPSLNVGEIPAGAYSGNPLIPKNNLATIAVNRLLIGSKNADDEAIKIITQVLFERRLELLKTTPLAGFISQPDWDAGTFIPLHEGAMAFYNRENPSFFVENADFIALVISILFMLGSFFLGLRNKISGNQKNNADRHTKELIEIMDAVNSNTNISREDIDAQKSKLQKMLSVVVNELDEDRMTLDGFQFFSFTWDKANELLERIESKILQ